ncbi:MAG TPA: phosphate ABC transporter ATP-binding protein PstB [Chitinophagales bacterium]|nr:phosphate ABC transporter ATP-binding protein PstB [Chitinophagales bacterium]HMU68752.1 phosphate ABC transporter ATP-binding protein PstB [Chitinophagales bacterium]HMX03876.1 phosphate ABC transporter ATP-binding protein PstB [Chitinophagales bacterium]HMZ90080.1 phosphate ABC transporter ATP-binding protein PstB [Chitinophagales bacterium]HNA57177.1 phosphate ABC transporter ATP-binding protein PstB [Chitinophagales bacterium]
MTSSTIKSHISIKDLNMHYGKNHALKNISINIPDKKLTAIIGPSGCGKTTLLKTFNRLIENVDGTNITGEVLVDGENIYGKNADVTNIRKKMGLLNQRPTPLPMSIYDNIAFGMSIHGIKQKGVLNEKVEHFLRVASLWDEVKDRLHSPAARLSIGQQQRLCLARGLAVEPEIILGDEPTSALDPISTKHIEQKFVELKEQYTIVMVTHILRQARRIADYVIFMYLGEIIEHGPTEMVLGNPQHQLTKDYVGGAIS